MTDLPARQRVEPLGEPLLTAEQVAEYLQVDRSTVYRLAAAPGGLPVVELSPRVRRFRPADVEAFLERRTREPKARTGRARRLLAASRHPAANELATSRRKSVHRKQESSRGSASATKEAAR
jgi:excisionase family DNA binding protein